MEGGAELKVRWILRVVCRVEVILRAVCVEGGGGIEGGMWRVEVDIEGGCRVEVDIRVVAVRVEVDIEGGMWRVE